MKLASVSPLWVFPLVCTIMVGLTFIETIGTWYMILSGFFAAGFLAVTVYTYILAANKQTIFDDHNENE